MLPAFVKIIISNVLEFGSVLLVIIFLISSLLTTEEILILQTEV